MHLAQHHAYLVKGGLRDTTPELFLKETGLLFPDGTILNASSFETLGIDDARELFASQLYRTETDAPRVFLVETAFITREAQNAMLKMLEEPTANTHFVFVTPHPELLLPTLRSRLVFLDAASKKYVTNAKDFVAASPKERLAFIAPLLEEGNRSDIEIFMRGILVHLHEKGLQDKDNMSKYIGQLDRLHGYITDTSSSGKLILEYLTYVLPSS